MDPKSDTESCITGYIRKRPDLLTRDQALATMLCCTGHPLCSCMTATDGIVLQCFPKPRVSLPKRSYYRSLSIQLSSHWGPPVMLFINQLTPVSGGIFNLKMSIFFTFSVYTLPVPDLVFLLKNVKHPDFQIPETRKAFLALSPNALSREDRGTFL